MLYPLSYEGRELRILALVATRPSVTCDPGDAAVQGDDGAAARCSASTVAWTAASTGFVPVPIP